MRLVSLGFLPEPRRILTGATRWFESDVENYEYRLLRGDFASMPETQPRAKPAKKRNKPDAE